MWIKDPDPDPVFSRIRIRVTKKDRIRPDPDPQHWVKTFWRHFSLHFQVTKVKAEFFKTLLDCMKLTKHPILIIVLNWKQEAITKQWFHSTDLKHSTGLKTWSAFNSNLCAISCLHWHFTDCNGLNKTSNFMEFWY